MYKAGNAIYINIIHVQENQIGTETYIWINTKNGNFLQEFSIKKKVLTWNSYDNSKSSQTNTQMILSQTNKHTLSKIKYQGTQSYI